MKSVSILLAALPSIYAQSAQMMDMSMEMECNGALHTVVYEFPAFFSTVYESASTIFNFMGGTNSLVIDNPPQTIVTSTILTTTVVSTVSMTATVTSNPQLSATLGAGIPSGTVTSVPSTIPFALGYLDDALLASETPSGFSTNNGTSSDPSNAQFWYIQDGQLHSIDGGVVGRNFSDNYAALIPSNDHNDVTTNFTLVNGMLQWNSPDKGLATFYNCAGNLYAGFSSAPFGNCTVVTIGGISRYVVDAMLALSASASASASLGAASSTSSMTTTSPSMSGSMTSGTAMSSSMMSSSTMSNPVTSGSSSMSNSAQTSSSATSSASSTTSTSSMSKSMSSTMSSSSKSSMTTSLTTPKTSSGAGTTTTSSQTTMTSSGTTTSSPTSTPSGIVSAILCPADDNEVVQGYNIYCGKGIDGTNLGTGSQVADFQTCVTLCTDTTGCVSVSFNTVNSYCYLHSTRHTTVTDITGQYDSAELVDNSSSSSTMSSSSSTTTSDDGSGGQTTASTTDDGGAGTTSSTTTSAMTTTTASTTDDGSEGTSTTSSMTTTTSASSGEAAICPGTADGDVVDGYHIYCNQVVDPVIDADTITPAPSDIQTLADCLAYCDSTPLCTGLSYFQPGTTCYVHTGENKSPAAPPGDGWSGAILVGDEPGSGTTTTVTSTTPSTATTTVSTSSTTSASSTSSSTSSASTTTTTAAAGGGGTTTTTSSSTSTTTAAGGGSGYDDPSCSQDTIDPDATQYKVFCGQALTSSTTVGTVFQVDSLAACVQQCDVYSATPGNLKCISVTWHYLGGGVQPCYLHTGNDIGFNGQTGYHSAILDDGSNNSDPCLPGGNCSA